MASDDEQPAPGAAAGNLLPLPQISPPPSHVIVKCDRVLILPLIFVEEKKQLLLTSRK